MRRLGCFVAIAAVLVPASAAAPTAVVGEQRVLVLLATWGPEPWTRGEVERALVEADSFIRKTSFGKLELRGTVTTWLRGYPAFPECPPPEHERIPTALTDGPDAAAEAAGFRVASYDRVVYIVPRLDCPWLGVGVGRQVMLNGTMNAWGIVHELGHTYGLAHAHGRDCPTCRNEEYGDPYSPMGHGLVDFSAFEKVHLGWIADVPRAARPGRYVLGRPDVLDATPHALVVESGAGEFWFEQRLDVSSPGLAVRKMEQDVPDDDLTPPTLYLQTVTSGGTFREPGAFSIRYAASGLEFAWIDRARPPSPRVAVPARARAGRPVRVSWTASDPGSGIAGCTLSVDRRVTARGAARGAFTIGRLNVGRHAVAVACVDRAGNASRSTTKRIRIVR